MVVNIFNEILIVLIDCEFELEEWCVWFVKLCNENECQKEENKVYKFDVFDWYKVYVMENINDLCIKE